MLMQRLSPYADKAATAVQRWGGQASQAASRYGQQAYVWVTQFFNSPTGQEVTAAAAEMATGSKLPYGFTSSGQFQPFGKAVSSGLREVAGDGVQAFLGGSTTTGKSFSTGAAFDLGRTSDFDIAVVGTTRQGESYRTVRSRGIESPRLEKLVQRLSQQAGRPVNFMIYESEEALRQRGAPYQGLQ